MGWQLQETKERTKGTILHEFPAPPTRWFFLSNSRFCAHLILGTPNHPLFAYVSRPPFSTSIICGMRTKHIGLPYSTARTSRSFVAALPELSSVNILKPTTIHILASLRTQTRSFLLSSLKWKNSKVTFSRYNFPVSQLLPTIATNYYYTTKSFLYIDSILEHSESLQHNCFGSNIS